MVALGGDVLSRYVAFSRFNSPYPAHDRGRAVDLYPDSGAPSPVAGEVTQTRSVQCPDRPYAEDRDYLIVIDTGEHLARILHVEPEVESGARVSIGENLGRTVRSGYFAPWVDNHLHVGFREPGTDPVRASGSLPVELGIDVEGVAWDGTGTVVETGETYVVLDGPGHPGEGFAGIAADGGGVLDGGLAHYDGGGLVGGDDGTVRLLGEPIGRSREEVVDWTDLEVRANGTTVTGLSLGCYRDRLGAKLVAWDGVPADVGEEVSVEIRVS